MRWNHLLALVSSTAPAFTLGAQPVTTTRPPPPPWEWRTQASFTGRSAIAEGSRALGTISHAYFAADLRRHLQLNPGSSLSLAGRWQEFAFAGSRADVPGRVRALALRIGYDRRLSDRWSVSGEIAPGFYSDFTDLDARDINVPLMLSLLSESRRDLQWGLAVIVDPWRPNPIVGGPGVRWQFAPRWTLVGFPPEPRLEYRVSPGFGLQAGVNLRSGTFRVAQDFGRRRGRPMLDGQLLDFREITAGLGARWELSPGLTMLAAMGWTVDRRFEYERRDLLLNGDGAVNVTVSIRGGF